MSRLQDEIDQIDLPLQLVTAEIERIGRILDELRERSAVIASDGSSNGDAGALAKAQAIYRFRRARDEEFGSKLFCDPSWDILLDLFIAAEQGKQISISSACIGSSAPATTALRHLSALVKYGLVSRNSSETDCRVTWVAVTPLGQSKLNAVLRSFSFSTTSLSVLEAPR